MCWLHGPQQSLPKDCYPLPRIDGLVDSATSNEVLFLLDFFKEYHQIGMSAEDQEKTAFITEQSVFCYTSMQFGLKNVGATYQRLVNKIFHDQINKNVEVYVNDLLIESRSIDSFIADLKEIFKVPRSSWISLNP